MNKTRVVNLCFNRYDVYIGRGGYGKDGAYGNPHLIGYCPICKTQHDRASCIAAFKKDFLVRIESDSVFKEKVLELRGKRLGCFCAPKLCHGNVYKDWLDSQ